MNFTAGLFGGDSFLMYRADKHENFMNNATHTYISFNFSTIHLNGMILWTGQVCKIGLKIVYFI